MAQNGTETSTVTGTPSVDDLVITIENEMISITSTETNDLAELQVCNLDQFIADLKTAVLESDKPHAAMVRAVISACAVERWQAENVTVEILESLKAEGVSVR